MTVSPGPAPHRRASRTETAATVSAAPRVIARWGPSTLRRGAAEMTVNSSTGVATVKVTRLSASMLACGTSSREARNHPTATTPPMVQNPSKTASTTTIIPDREVFGARWQAGPDVR